MQTHPDPSPRIDGPDGPDDPEAAFTTTALGIEAWPDALIDRLGHDPRSAYVERFWLGILGPSTVLLMRRLAHDLEDHPEGFTIDLADMASSLGVGMRGGRQSPFMRTIDRVCRFGVARWQTPERLAVRRKLAPLTRNQLSRLTPTLQLEHQEWIESHGTADETLRRHERAQHLALSLLELGEDAEATERQLHRWRFHPAVAHDALRWALERYQSDQAETPDLSSGRTGETTPRGAPHAVSAGAVLSLEPGA